MRAENRNTGTVRSMIGTATLDHIGTRAAVAPGVDPGALLRSIQKNANAWGQHGPHYCAEVEDAAAVAVWVVSKLQPRQIKDLNEAAEKGAALWVRTFGKAVNRHTTPKGMDRTHMMRTIRALEAVGLTVKASSPEELAEITEDATAQAAALDLDAAKITQALEVFNTHRVGHTVTDAGQGVDTVNGAPVPTQSEADAFRFLPLELRRTACALSEGVPVREIAAAQGVTPRTIRNQRDRIAELLTA